MHPPPLPPTPSQVGLDAAGKTTILYKLKLGGEALLGFSLHEEGLPPPTATAAAAACCPCNTLTSDPFPHTPQHTNTRRDRDDHPHHR